VAEYEHAVGKPPPSVIIGGEKAGLSKPRTFSSPHLRAIHMPMKISSARAAKYSRYEAELDRMHLDGFVYS
jgi:hypothetical protein